MTQLSLPMRPRAAVAKSTSPTAATLQRAASPTLSRGRSPNTKSNKTTNNTIAKPSKTSNSRKATQSPTSARKNLFSTSDKMQLLAEKLLAEQKDCLDEFFAAGDAMNASFRTALWALGGGSTSGHGLSENSNANDSASTATSEYGFSVCDEAEMAKHEEYCNSQFRTPGYEKVGVMKGSTGLATASGIKDVDVEMSSANVQTSATGKNLEFGFELPVIGSWSSFDRVIDVSGPVSSAAGSGGATIKNGKKAGSRRGSAISAPLRPFGRNSMDRKWSVGIERIMPELAFGVQCDLERLNVWA